MMIYTKKKHQDDNLYKEKHWHDDLYKEEHQHNNLHNEEHQHDDLHKKEHHQNDLHKKEHYNHQNEHQDCNTKRITQSDEFESKVHRISRGGCSRQRTSGWRGKVDATTQAHRA